MAEETGEAAMHSPPEKGAVCDFAEIRQPFLSLVISPGTMTS
jgi:hypothetical protein